MIWLAILIILAIGFVLLCADKMRKISRKERERRNIIDEMELHELLEHYRDFDEYDD
jgi:Sec-independent protein translocase protein TatA